MPGASPLWGVTEPGYTPAGKQTKIAGLRPLSRDGCGRPGSCAPAYEKDKTGNQQRCVSRRLGAKQGHGVLLFVRALAGGLCAEPRSTLTDCGGQARAARGMGRSGPVGGGGGVS